MVRCGSATIPPLTQQVGSASWWRDHGLISTSHNWRASHSLWRGSSLPDASCWKRYRFQSARVSRYLPYSTHCAYTGLRRSRSVISGPARAVIRVLRELGATAYAVLAAMETRRNPPTRIVASRLVQPWNDAASVVVEIDERPPLRSLAAHRSRAERTSD